MEKNTTNQPEVLSEFGARPDAPIQEVLRAHYLQGVDSEKGPPQIVNPGQLVRLTPATQEENFHICRINPLELSTRFVCTRSFRTVEDGLFVDVVQGDEIELGRVEALALLRRHCVKPLQSVVLDNEKGDENK